MVIRPRPPPAFICVKVVTCSLAQGSQTADDVARLITTFLDPSRSRTLAHAAALGSPYLLQRWLFFVKRHVRHGEWVDAMESAATHGHFESLHWLRAFRLDRVIPREALDAAASMGHHAIAEWLNSVRPNTFSYKSFDEAAQNGHLVLVQWLHSLGVDATEKAISNAAKGGHLHVVEWLLAHRVEGSCRIASKAASGGHMHILNWVETNMPDELVLSTSLAAAKHGQTGSLDWLFTRGYLTLDSNTINQLMSVAGEHHAAILDWLTAKLNATPNIQLSSPSVAIQRVFKKGDLNTLQWMCDHMHNDSWKDAFYTPCLLAVQSVRDVNVVFWLWNRLVQDGWEKKSMRSPVLYHLAAQGLLSAFDQFYRLYPPEETMLECAAKGGNLDMIRWTFEKHPFECSSYVISVVAQLGHLPLLKRMTESSGLNCSSEDLSLVAKSGHVDCLRYLHEVRGVALPPDALYQACGSGHLEMMKYLFEKSSLEWTKAPMDNAAAHGHLELVIWLHERGVACSTLAMDMASTRGDLDIVQWLHTYRTEGCTTEAMDGAAGSGFLDVVKYLHENRSEGATSRAITRAAANKHFAVVKWLRVHRSEGYRMQDIAGAPRHIKSWLLKHYPDRHSCGECSSDGAPGASTRNQRTDAFSRMNGEGESEL